MLDRRQILSGMAALAATPVLAQTAPSLEELQNPNSDFYRDRQTFVPTGAREQALASAARGVGVRGGFRFEAERINAQLEGNRSTRSALDRQLNYAPLMMQRGYVVPPVITEIRNVEELNGERFLYLTSGSFEIVRDARLATLPPHWRDYLILPLQDPRPPQRLTAETNAERRLWAQEVESGYQRGITEAREAFRLGLNLATRDLRGMQRYHELQRQGIVSLPRIDISQVPVRVTEDGKRAFVGETSIRMIVEPKFVRRRG